MSEPHFDCLIRLVIYETDNHHRLTLLIVAVVLFSLCHKIGVSNLQRPDNG